MMNIPQNQPTTMIEMDGKTPIIRSFDMDGTWR